MNYKEFTLGCITVIIIVLIVIGFLYPNTIYDFGMISLTAISTIAWVILYISTRTLHCTQKENPKGLICEIKGSKEYNITYGEVQKYGGNITISDDLKNEVSNNYKSAMNIKEEYQKEYLKKPTNKKEHDNILNLFDIIEKNNKYFNTQLNNIEDNTDVKKSATRAKDYAQKIQTALDDILNNNNSNLKQAVDTVKAAKNDDDDDVDDDVIYYLSQQQSEKVSEPYKPSKSYGSDNTNFDKFYNKTINNNLI